MKIFTLIILLFSQHSPSSDRIVAEAPPPPPKKIRYENCCFCIDGNPGDNTSKDTLFECKSWLKSAKTKYRCEKNQILARSTAKDAQSVNEECNTVHVWGAFHAISENYREPFDIAEKLHHEFHPTHLSYDGSTCLIFNEIDDVKRTAMDLAAKKLPCSFSISGNQNYGSCFYNYILRSVHEVQKEASKLTVKIDSSGLRLEFADCSKPKGNCFYAHPDFPAKSNPNTKSCTHNNKTVDQYCCPVLDRKSKIKDQGYWSEPGSPC